jgi:mono/diheme cytochrome c family protein
MNRAWAVLVVAAFGGLVAVSARAQDAAKIEKGKKVYDAAVPKCKVCHSIGGAGNVKGPLDGVGSKLKAEEVKAWMRTPKEMTEKTKSARKPPMPAYPKDKMSDEDLDALSAYMLSLKK